MYSAYLKNSSLWAPLLQHSVLTESLVWLKKNATTAEFANYELGKPGWYANIHGYETPPDYHAIRHARTPPVWR